MTPPAVPASASDRTATHHLDGGAFAWPSRLRSWLHARDATLWLLLALAALSLVPRLYGINWDAGNHLHPDEREIVFRAMCLSLPGTPRAGSCDPAYTGAGWLLSPSSPLNPHFFAYGSFPLYLLAGISHLLAWLNAHLGARFAPPDGGAWDDFTHFTLVGRALSALFDGGTVFVTGLVARRLSGPRTALLAAALVAVIPFEVQVAHFYAVDTLLLFFVMLTLLACVRLAQGDVGARGSDHAGRMRAVPSVWGAWRAGCFVGASFALALATKVSALPLLAPIVVALVLLGWRRGLDVVLPAVLGLVVAGAFVYLVTSPYTLIDWHTFITQVHEQTALAQGTLDYPYVRQFAGTTPYVYEIQQLLLYDMGLPLGLLGLVGAAWAASRLWRSLNTDWAIIVVWLVGYFAVVGGAYTKFTRYMLPELAPLVICGAAALAALAAWGTAHVLRAQVAVSRDRPGARAGHRARWAAWRERLDPLSGALARRLTVLFGVRWWRGLCCALALAVLAFSTVLSLALVNIYSAPNTRVQASQWIYDHVPAGSVLTNEVWDDPLPILAPTASYNAAGQPLTSAGHVINPGQYVQEGLNLYDADTTTKATQLAQQLASANVVVISSQRLLDSIPKLPDRYPMTIRYYHLLFSGKLGFTLAAHFETHPHLLGFTFNDSGADESFSVYDHPPVWLFVKHGAGLTAGQLQSLLTNGIDFEHVTNRPGNQLALALPASDASANTSTRPLLVQFPPNSLANQVPILAWLLAVELLGLVTFPLAAWAFPGLFDRGWGVSKLLGMLLLGYFVWLPASLHLAPFTRTTVFGAFAVLTLAGAAVGWTRRNLLVGFVRQRWRTLLVCELAFLVAFLAFTWIRALDPDLWQIYRGGEKPMELAFLNGILRSRYMPPADPWFSGGYINYYYYGQYLVAVLIRLTGIIPTTAFNLAIPLLFAVTLTGAFSLVCGITRRIWAGLAAGFGLLVVGNLDGLWQLLAIVRDRAAGLIPPPFDYWQSSRVIPFTINEFPYWSFLYADLHAHLIDLPVVVLLLCCCASLLMSSRREQARWRPALPTLGVVALALGAAWCINTWDLPTYALVVGLALALRLVLPGSQSGGWRGIRARVRWPVLRGYVVALALTGGLTYALYLPFHSHFESFVAGTGPVTTPTNPGQFVTLFGLWLLIAASFFFVEAREALERGARVGAASGATRRLYVLLAFAVGMLVLSYFAGVKVLLVLLLLVGLALACNPRHSPAKLFTYLLLLMGLAIALGVEFVYVRDFLDHSPWERMNTVFKFYYQVWTCFALGGTLALAHLLPLLGGVTSPLEDEAVAGEAQHALAPAQPAPVAAATWTLAEVGPLVLRSLWVVALTCLVAGSCVFAVMGTQARLRDPSVWAQVQPPPGGVQPVGLSLDGMAYMRGWYPGDYAAITWMNERIGGDPTIVEASNGPYAWYGRVSIYTGLPAVLGWSSHEAQQRAPDVAYTRQSDVQQFYGTSQVAVARTFLRDYNVQYVYLGALERNCYMTDATNACTPMSGAALSKFATLQHDGVLRPVYSNTDVTIYQVTLAASVAG